MPIGNFVRLFQLIKFFWFLWKVLTGRLPENTDHICEGTSDQLDISCSTTTSDNYQNLQMDEFYCEYDSTWETNSSKTKETSRQKRHRSLRFKRFRDASRDMQNYRHNYPEKYTRNHHENATPNLDFYLGKRRSVPDGFSIEEFHNNWFGQYQRLENVHSFIQWLFPLQEPGMNWQAFELTEEEIQAFQKNQKAKKNLLASYKLMLDFYGLKLSNETTGEVKKSPLWQDQFKNLDRNTHNNLRITRILKCLGTLGYAHYQAPLVQFFLEETLVHENLPNVKESVLNYFMFTVLDKMKRRELIEYAYHHFKESEFVWCPKKIQMAWNEQEGKRTKQEKPVATSHQNTKPRSNDEKEINYKDVDFKQASTVHKISQHGQPAQKFSYDEEEKNEGQAKEDLECSPKNTDSPGNKVNFSVSSTDNGQSTAGKDTDMSTNLYAEQAIKYENNSGQVHSPENHSMDPTDSNVNPSDSSTINSSQRSDGEKNNSDRQVKQSHADIKKDGLII